MNSSPAFLNPLVGTNSLYGEQKRNCRPISELPVVSKVPERLIHKQLASYFDDHNLLSKTQSGFRRMHSTETAVTYFADEMVMNMDKGLVTGSVFIDLAKAFNTVDHLLSKLEYYSVCDQSLQWFKNSRTKLAALYSATKSLQNSCTAKLPLFSSLLEAKQQLHSSCSRIQKQAFEGSLKLSVAVLQRSCQLSNAAK